jgi:hypothetical protein
MTKLNKDILFAALKRAGVTDERIAYELGLDVGRCTLKAMKAACLKVDDVTEDALYRVQLARACFRCGGPAEEMVSQVLYGYDSTHELTQTLIDLCAETHGEPEASPDAHDHVFGGVGEEAFVKQVAKASARCWSCHALTEVEALSEWTGHHGDTRLVCDACRDNTGPINLVMTDILAPVFTKKD